LALTSVARAHELSSLDMTYSLKKERSWEFTFPTHFKTSRPGHSACKIFLSSFPQNLKICVVRSFTGYVQKRRSCILPQNSCVIFPLTKLFQASLFLDGLMLAGIGLGYTGHSTRGASTSAAAAAGLSVELVLEAADWASTQTFKHFYHREESSGSFVRAVLNSGTDFWFCLYFRIFFLLLLFWLDLLYSMPLRTLLNVWLCYFLLFLRLVVSLWNSAPVLLISVWEGWRRDYISLEGQYLPFEEIWFSEALIDWYEQYWSPSHWSYLPSPPCCCQSVWSHSPLLWGRVHALRFLYIVVPRLQPRDTCTSIAHISLRGVWRAISPHQVSTDPPGK